MSAQAESKAQRPWLLYLLECVGDKLYVGISPDPEARFKLHLEGSGARYTRANPPLRILAVQAYPDRSAASVAEYQLKKLRRPGKLLWARDRAWPLAPSKAVRKPARKRAAKASGG